MCIRDRSRLKNIVRDYNPNPVLVCKAMSKPRLSAGKKAPAIPEKVREMTAQERKQWAENRIATVQKPVSYTHLDVYKRQGANDVYLLDVRRECLNGKLAALLLDVHTHQMCIRDRRKGVRAVRM